MAKKKIGIALGGGGAKGVAHIGVLKVLQENNIPIDYIAGTSMGAVIGAFFCAEMNIKKVEKDFLAIDWKNIFDYSIPTKGFLKGDKIEKILRDKFGDLTFNDLKIPLQVTSFDIEKKREVVFSKGDLVKALRASISLPGIFIPVVNNKKVLVDGGMVDPVPTEILKDKADIIIAVNVNKEKNRVPLLNEEAHKAHEAHALPGILKCATKSLQILNSKVSDADLVGEEIDFIIDINLEEIGGLDFVNPKKVIKKGELATRKLLKEIKSASEPNIFKEFLIGLEKGLEKNVIETRKIKEDIEKLGGT